MFVKTPISAAMKQQLRPDVPKSAAQPEPTTPPVSAREEKVWKTPEDEFRVDL